MIPLFTAITATITASSAHGEDAVPAVPHAKRPAATPAPATETLEFANGIGGFANGGKEYVTTIGGGPAPDGQTADLFYRADQPGDLTRLVEDDPYFTGGVWTAYEPRTFAQFLEPWERIRFAVSAIVHVVRKPAGTLLLFRKPA